jgi:hypothetical protein
MRTQWVIALALVGLAARLTVACADDASAEEFVGPFPSWKNLKTHYGAVGDGKADDTAAIQKAFDDLRLHQDACVLYLPSGTYRITDTVKTFRGAHQDCMGITVIGEDPATTIIRWDGAQDGMMVKYDAWYSKISRLTLDGAGKAAVALAYGDAFSTYNETSDMVFQDVAVGMSMGTADNGQAENAVLRCVFRRCTDAGLRTNNFNSMDIWAWYCVFEDCGHGLFNAAGNFHAYECLFLRSRKADIGTANLMVFSFVNNTSIGSHCFLDFSGGHTWGSPCSITGNRIVEPTGQWAIRLSNGGPYLVMDNAIRARPQAQGPLVEMTWGDQAFVGNRYTVENAVKESGRFRRLDEQVVEARTISAAAPALPPTPPRRERKVIEVPPGADAAAIQAAIDAAARLKGQRPVVHLPKSTYNLERTLTVPAGCDVQLIGDGGAETGTVLIWTGAPGGLVLRLQGPSVATVRDLFINSGDANGILIEDCDQPGGRVFTDQLNVSRLGPDRNPVGVLVRGVEESDVLLRCVQGGHQCDTWLKVLGGPRQRAGQRTEGQVAAYCGATGTANAQYAVEDGGRLVVRSIYHEMSGEAPRGLWLTDAGSLTIDATRLSYKTSPDAPLIGLEGFRGDFGLFTSLLLPVDSTHTAWAHISGEGTHTAALLMGDLFWVNELGVTADSVFKAEAQPPARAGMLLCNVNSGLEGATRHGGFDTLEDRGEVGDALIRRLLRPLRQARVWTPQPRPEGVTNAQLHRVICFGGAQMVQVELRGGRGR